MPKTVKSDKDRKVSFILSPKDHDDLALYTSAQPGGRSPGPFFKELALGFVTEGRKLRAKINGSAVAAQKR